MSTFKKELTVLRSKYSLLKYRDCTPEEAEKYKNMTELPDNIKKIDPWEEGNRTTIYRCEIEDADGEYQDRIEFLQLKQTEHLNSIRKMMLFFVVLTCISLAAGILIALNFFS